MAVFKCFRITQAFVFEIFLSHYFSVLYTYIFHTHVFVTFLLVLHHHLALQKRHIQANWGDCTPGRLSLHTPTAGNSWNKCQYSMHEQLEGWHMRVTPMFEHINDLGTKLTYLAWCKRPVSEVVLLAPAVGIFSRNTCKCPCKTAIANFTAWQIPVTT